LPKGVFHATGSAQLASKVQREGASGLDVIERLKRRDEAALQSLMEIYGDYLLRTAYLLLKDRQAAEEAVQDTFITAYYKIGQLAEPSRLKGWLTRIAVNRCRMKLRTWDWNRLLSYARMESFLGDDPEPGPEERFFLERRTERLTDAVHRLTYLYRETITLYYYNELAVREIAEQLGTNENTVKARLARGRSMLKRIWEEGDNDEQGQRVGKNTIG
jgi:RNA polymerase sigma-70 factor (ECF subfamily)